MKNQNELLKILNIQLQELVNITCVSSHSLPFANINTPTIREKFSRWCERTAQIVEKYLGSKEIENFDQCLMNIDLETQISQCNSYLKVLIDEIKNYPESFEETQNNEPILSQSEMEKIWEKDYINKTLVFLSHKAEYKEKASQIKKFLKRIRKKLKKMQRNFFKNFLIQFFFLISFI